MCLSAFHNLIFVVKTTCLKVNRHLPSLPWVTMVTCYVKFPLKSFESIRDFVKECTTNSIICSILINLFLKAHNYDGENIFHVVEITLLQKYFVSLVSDHDTNNSFSLSSVLEFRISLRRWQIPRTKEQLNPTQVPRKNLAVEGPGAR